MKKFLSLLLLILLLAPAASAANFHIASWVTTNNAGPVCDLNNPTVGFTLLEGQSQNYCAYVTPFSGEGYTVTTRVTNLATGATQLKSEYISDETQFPEVSVTSNMYQGAGDYRVRITVDGDLTLPIYKELNLEVLGSNTNTAPSLINPGDRTIDEGQSLSFNLQGSDSQGDALTYSMSGNPAWLTLLGNRVSGTAPAGSAAVSDVTFLVSDGEFTTSQSVTITVNAVDTNNAPVLQTISDAVIYEQDSLAINLIASDIDGDALTYSATNLPTWITQSNNVFTGTAPQGSAGNYSVTFAVTDGEETVLQTINIEVLTRVIVSTNNPPVFTQVTDRYVDEGNLLQFQIIATDSDGDALTYLVQGLPINATFDSTTRTFSWNTVDGNDGSYAVTFYVNDGVASDSMIVNIHVQDVTNSNNPQINGLNIFEDNQFTQIGTSFYRGDLMYVSFMLTNNGAAIVDSISELRFNFESGAVITGNQLSNSNGVYYYELEIPTTDGALGNVHSLEIDTLGQTLNQPVQLEILNHAPVIDELAFDDLFSLQFDNNYVFDLALFASDNEDANLNWFVSDYDPNVVQISLSGTIATMNVQTDGNTIITFRVYDHNGASDEYVVNFVANTTQVTPNQCEDSIDNDNDGLTDLNDPDCDNGNDDSEHTIAQCADGIDNDNDGLTDLNDPQCQNLSDDDEGDNTQPTTQCSDGIDNDNDGLVDMQDPDCSSSSDNSESSSTNPVITRCNDGIDNDGDGFTDIYDVDCSSFSDSTETSTVVDEEDEDDTFSSRKVSRGNDVYITRTSLLEDSANPGDGIIVSVSLENELGFDLEDVDVTAYLADVDWTKSRHFDIDSGDQVSLNLQFDVPELMPGTYDLGLIIQNDNVRRVVWRDLHVMG